MLKLSNLVVSRIEGIRYRKFETKDIKLRYKYISVSTIKKIYIGLYIYPYLYVENYYFL